MFSKVNSWRLEFEAFSRKKSERYCTVCRLHHVPKPVDFLQFPARFARAIPFWFRFMDKSPENLPSINIKSAQVEISPARKSQILQIFDSAAGLGSLPRAWRCTSDQTHVTHFLGLLLLLCIEPIRTGRLAQLQPYGRPHKFRNRKKCVLIELDVVEKPPFEPSKKGHKLDKKNGRSNSFL